MRGGARGVRQVHGSRLSAPRHRLPPRLPLLRGEGGAGTVEPWWPRVNLLSIPPSSHYHRVSLSFYYNMCREKNIVLWGTF